MTYETRVNEIAEELAKAEWEYWNPSTSWEDAIKDRPAFRMTRVGLEVRRAAIALKHCAEAVNDFGNTHQYRRDYLTKHLIANGYMPQTTG